jgi:hypothetical protein
VEGGGGAERKNRGGGGNGGASYKPEVVREREREAEQTRAWIGSLKTTIILKN